MAHPVQSTTLDGRLREGNTYLEHSAPEVSLDSELMEGISRLEPFAQSVPNMRSVARSDGGSIKEFANWDAVAHPVPDINLDGRPMEGHTYLEPSVLGVSLDSGLMEGMSHPEPLEQSVLGALSVVRPDETYMSERPALASQMNHKQSRFKSSTRPMLDPDKVDNADVNTDVNTDLPESSALMRNLDLRFWQSDTQLCPSVTDTLHRRPMEGISGRLLVKSPGPALAPDSGHVKYPPNPSPFEQVALGVNRGSDNLHSCDEPQFGSNSGQSCLEWEDVIRHAVLKSRSMDRVPDLDDNGLMLSPVEACLVIRNCLWMRSGRRAYNNGTWTWMWNTNMRHLMVCRCIMAVIYVIRRN